MITPTQSSFKTLFIWDCSYTVITPTQSSFIRLYLFGTVSGLITSETTWLRGNYSCVSPTHLALRSMAMSQRNTGNFITVNQWLLLSRLLDDSGRLALMAQWLCHWLMGWKVVGSHLRTGSPDGAMAMSSANGLVGTGFASRYHFSRWCSDYVIS